MTNHAHQIDSNIGVYLYPLQRCLEQVIFGTLGMGHQKQ